MSVATMRHWWHRLFAPRTDLASLLTPEAERTAREHEAASRREAVRLLIQTELTIAKNNSHDARSPDGE